MPDPPLENAEALGSRAVARARRSLDESVTGRAAASPGAGRRPTFDAGEPEFSERRGVFVTLLAEPGARLRGCIGFPQPSLPLGQAIAQAARAAALEDPRFPPVIPEELDRILVEVSILTVPELVPGAPGARADRVVVGRDGLLLVEGSEAGLLLPQVAPEQGWNAREFLEGVSEKAGLPRDAWSSPRSRLFRFRAEIYRESRPRGPAVPGGDR